MRLKIRDSHLACKVANKCLNVREWVEVGEWNKRRSPPFPCCPVSRQCPWKKTLIEKKKGKKCSLELAFSAKFNDFGSFCLMYLQMVLLAKFRVLQSQKILSIYSWFNNLFLLGMISFGISSCEMYINLLNFSLNSFSLWGMNTLRLNVYLHSFRSLKKPNLQTFRRLEN